MNEMPPGQPGDAPGTAGKNESRTSESRTSESLASASPVNYTDVIASLRTAGADRFDPVRLHYAEVLAARARTQQGAVRRLLDARLAHILADLRQRFGQAQCDASDTMAQSITRYPHAAASLQQLFADGDFAAVTRYAGTLGSSAQQAGLGALVRQLEQPLPGSPTAHPDDHPGARNELKALRHFRNTWSTLSAQKQVTQALEQAPKNAGPINSHRLVLQSLALMRDISPDYLQRFVSYADTLLCLDHGDRDKQAVNKKTQPVKAAKK